MDANITTVLPLTTSSSYSIDGLTLSFVFKPDPSTLLVNSTQILFDSTEGIQVAIRGVGSTVGASQSLSVGLIDTTTSPPTEYFSSPFHHCSIQSTVFAELIISKSSRTSRPTLAFLSKSGPVSMATLDDSAIAALTNGVSEKISGRSYGRLGCSVDFLTKISVGDQSCFTGNLQSFALKRSGQDILNIVDTIFFDDSSSSSSASNSTTDIQTSLVLDHIQSTIKTSVGVADLCLNTVFDADSGESCDPTAPSSDSNAAETCSCACEKGCSSEFIPSDQSDPSSYVLTLSSLAVAGSVGVLTCATGYTAPDGFPTSVDVTCSGSSWTVSQKFICRLDCTLGSQPWFALSQFASKNSSLIVTDPELTTNVRNVSISDGSAITIACNTSGGYARSSYSPVSANSETLMCLDGSLQRPSLSCGIPCKSLTLPVYLSSDSSSLNDGSSWTLSCASGYEPAPSSPAIQTVSCWNGQFSSVVINCLGSCAPLSLLDPEGLAVSPAEALTSTTFDGSQAILSCSAGYFPVPKLDGSAPSTQETIRCDGMSWETPTIRCEPACPAALLDAVFLSSQESVGYKITFQVQTATGTADVPHHGDQIVLECDTANGYYGVSASDKYYEVLRCSSGLWSKKSLECRKGCLGEPVISANGGIEVSRQVMGSDGSSTVSKSAVFRHGSWIEYGCAEGSQGIRTIGRSSTDASSRSRAYCFSGVWTRTDLKCKSNCQPLAVSTIFGVSLTGSNPTYSLGNSLTVTDLSSEENFQHGSTILVQCTTSTEAQGGDTDQNFVCMNGQWSRRTIQCEASCSPFNPLDYDRGLIVATDSSDVSSENGASLTITCDSDSGYVRLKGPEFEVVHCSKGVWTVPSIECGLECAPVVMPVPENRYVFVNSTYSFDSLNTTTALHGAWVEFRCNYESGYLPEMTPHAYAASNTRTLGVNLDSPAAVGRTTCANGKWSELDLRCVRQCQPFVVPNQNFAKPVSSHPFTNTSSTTDGIPATDNYTLNSTVSVPVFNSELLHGAVYTLTCKPNMGPAPAAPGYVSTQCIDGIWTSFNFNCYRSCPPWPATHFDFTTMMTVGGSLPTPPVGFNTPAGASRFRNVTHGTIVSLSCSTGYSNILATSLASKSTDLPSQCVDGLWTDAAIDCRLDCGVVTAAFSETTLMQTMSSGSSLSGGTIQAVNSTLLSETFILGKYRFTYPDFNVNMTRLPPAKDVGVYSVEDDGTISSDPPTTEDLDNMISSSFIGWTTSVWSHGDVLSVVCTNSTSPLFPDEADNLIKCIDGKWTDNTMHCAKNCDPLPNIPEGYAILPVNGNGKHGDNRRVECIRDPFSSDYGDNIDAPWPYGYVDIAEKMWQTITCQDGSWSSISLMCMRKCPVMITGDGYISVPNDNLLLENSTLILERDEGEFVHGAIRIVSCEEPFYSDRTTNLTAGIATCVNGQWSDPVIKCTPRCKSEDFPAFDDLHMTQPKLLAGQLFDHGFVIQVTCSPGASPMIPMVNATATSLKGSTVSQVTCLNGLWTPLTNRCMNNCKPYVGFNAAAEKIYKPVTKAEKTYENFIYDALTDSYTHGGNITVMCTATDYRDQSDIDHIRVDNANVTAMIGKTFYDRRSTEILTCHDGQWTTQTMRCRQSCGPFLIEETTDIDPYRYSITVPTFTTVSRGILEISVPETRFHGAQRNIRCSSKYGGDLPGPFQTPIDATITSQVAECRDGVWSAVTLQCERDCKSAYSVLDNAQRYSIYPLNTRSGSTVQVSCVSGYVPVENTAPKGYDELTCRDAKWTQPSLRCESTCLNYRDFITTYDSYVLTGCPPLSSNTDNNVLKVNSGSSDYFSSLGIETHPSCKIRYIISGNTGSEIPGSTVRLTCQPGYTSPRMESSPTDEALDDLEDITCVDGGWTPRNLNCMQSCINGPLLRLETWVTDTVSEVQLDALGDPFIVTYERAQEILVPGSNQTFYRHNSMAKVVCGPSFTPTAPSTSEQNLVCIDGSWTTQTLSCIPMCGDPEIDLTGGYTLVGSITSSDGTNVDPTTGSDSTNLYPSGSRQSVSCGDSYSLLGLSTNTFVFCQGGLWTQPTFSCMPMCPAPSSPPAISPNAAFMFYSNLNYDQPFNSYSGALNANPGIANHGGEFHVGCGNADGRAGTIRRAFINGAMAAVVKHSNIAFLKSNGEFRFTSHRLYKYGYFCQNCGIFMISRHLLRPSTTSSTGRFNPVGATRVLHDRFIKKRAHIGPFKRFVCQSGQWVGEYPSCTSMMRPKQISGSSISVVCSESWRHGRLDTRTFILDSMAGRLLPLFVMRGYHVVASHLMKGTSSPIVNLLFDFKAFVHDAIIGPIAYALGSIQEWSIPESLKLAHHSNLDAFNWSHYGGGFDSNALNITIFMLGVYWILMYAPLIVAVGLCINLQFIISSFLRWMTNFNGSSLQQHPNLNLVNDFSSSVWLSTPPWDRTDEGSAFVLTLLFIHLLVITILAPLMFMRRCVTWLKKKSE